MSDWPDDRIHSTALRYIGRHSMDPTTWTHTRLGDAHPELLTRVDLLPGELPLVSFLLSHASWYLFTTRRIAGSYAGRDTLAAALDVVDHRYGNFKGHGGTELDVMTLRLASGEDALLQYETGRASMAPMYYLRYWREKHPILDELTTDRAVARENRKRARRQPR